METTNLKIFDNYFSASITLAKLKNEGIICYLKDEYTSTINPIFGNIIGGIKLAVDNRHVEKAKILLKQYHDDFMKTATCSHCGLNEIILTTKNSPLNIITKILTWSFSGYGVSVEEVYQCQSCGHETKTLPESNEIEN
jgi:Putative prokaryotic signal transducing protein